jgi:hypothetical protein
MDRFEQLATDAQRALLILGCPSRRDYELLDLAACPIPESIQRNFHERGFEFIGLVGIVNGVAKTHLATALDSETIDALASAVLSRLGNEFTRRLANDPELVEHVEAQRVADDTAWLERYYARLYAPRV